MKIMAVDLGEARTGLAVCDRTEFLASPVGVIHEKNFHMLVQKVAVAAKEFDVQMVVVGLPKNMDGTCGDRAKKCQLFAEKLGEVIPLPIKMWDERQTTVAAHQYLNGTNVRGQKRKDMVDEVAATIILESYMEYRKNHPEEKEATK